MIVNALALSMVEHEFKSDRVQPKTLALSMVEHEFKPDRVQPKTI